VASGFPKVAEVDSLCLTQDSISGDEIELFVESNGVNKDRGETRIFESCTLMGDNQLCLISSSGPTSGTEGGNVSLVDSDEDDEFENVLPRSDQAACPLRSTLKEVFGHDDFRDGQEWLIQRCLKHERSLLVAPTGFGKSLCYALPAVLLDGVCIVVSPLLSLIQDQIRVLPPKLPAATLSGQMSTAAMAATIDDIIRGRIKVLFVSPERLSSSSFRRMFRQKWNQETSQYERQFPTVALLCVDEAHCLSQWAHNFRPSYLRIRSMVQIIQPQGIVAITATAGPRVVDDICRALEIPRSHEEGASSDSGVRVMNSNRDNIDVRCFVLSTQQERLSKVRLSRELKPLPQIFCLTVTR
jgi:ATP-dependent DNA helicase Q4